MSSAQTVVVTCGTPLQWVLVMMTTAAQFEEGFPKYIHTR